MAEHSPITFRLLTPNSPGPVAIFGCRSHQTHGNQASSTSTATIEPWLARITGKSNWKIGQMRLVRFGEIDVGLAGMLSPKSAWLMPHGGLRIVTLMKEHLLASGAVPESLTEDVPTIDHLQSLWTEADDALEAAMLWMIPRVASPAGVDLLLKQPRLWREWITKQQQGGLSGGEGRHPAPMNRRAIEELHERASRLRHLIEPASVVVAGPPNTGKSTLANTLAGRDVAITSDMQGTTRDYVGTVLDLNGLVVWWYDTPGRRETDDPIERDAIRLSESLIENADLLISVNSPDVMEAEPGKTGIGLLPRKPDLRICLKGDLISTGGMATDAHRAHAADDFDLVVSARTGDQLAELTSRINDMLVPVSDRTSSEPWLFDPALEALLQLEKIG